MESMDKKAKVVMVKDYTLFQNTNENSVIVAATQNLKKYNFYNDAKSVMSFSDLIKINASQDEKLFGIDIQQISVNNF